MAIETPVSKGGTQKTFNRLHADVAANKVKHIAVREANAALLVALRDRVFRN